MNRKTSAEQGHAEAQFNLGMMYESGKGVPQDSKEAVKWLRKAAEQEHTNAQYNLGVMYLVGKGVLGDYAEAYKWFLLAAMSGHKNATIYEEELRQNMTPSQVEEAQRRVKAFLEQHEEAFPE
jgi:TPR repeat protein